MKTVVVVPARLTSMRLPRKPLLDIKGIPMVVRVMQQAQKAQIGPVYVACCGQEIARIVEAYGGHVIITDPDLSSGTDRVWSGIQDHHDADIIVNVQGDLPFLDPQTIRAAQHALFSGREFGVEHDIGTVSMRGLAQHKASVVTIAMHEYGPLDGRALYFSRATIPHGAEIVDQHIGIYAYTRRALQSLCALPTHPLERVEKLEQLRALAYSMTIGVRRVNDHVRSVDTQEDLHVVRQ